MLDAARADADAPGGTAALVRLRRALLDKLPGQRPWRALEADMLHLLSSWFNPGFLEVRKVDWGSPAQLLEEFIHHEVVHEIDGWEDLHRRLQPDRLCFAFLHPQLVHRTFKRYVLSLCGNGRQGSARPGVVNVGVSWSPTAT